MPALRLAALAAAALLLLAALAHAQPDGPDVPMANAEAPRGQKRKAADGAMNPDPGANKHGKLPAPHDDDFGAEPVNANCDACANAYVVNNVPAGAFLETRASATAKLSANALAVINAFRALANGAAIGAMPNIHHLRVLLKTAAVSGASAATFTAAAGHAYGAAGGAGALPAPAATPAFPGGGAAALAIANFPQFPAAAAAAVGAPVAAVTLDGWTYQMDRFGRVAQASGVVTQATIANGEPANANSRDFVNLIANVAAAPAGHPNNAGHTRANSLGGSKDIINFVPQQPHNNQQIQCRLEMLTQALARDSHAQIGVIVDYAYPVAAGPTFYRPTAVRYRLALAAAPAVAGWAVGALNVDVTFPN
jgi:hypothetical protein